MLVCHQGRIKARRLRWFGHVSRMDSNRITFLALHTMVDGVRSRGRPRARGRDGVIEDIKERGLEIAEANLSLRTEMAGGSLLGPIVATARTDGTDDDDYLWISV